MNANLNNFTYLAKQIQKNYITNIFINKKPSSFFRLILIIKQEADVQKNKENMNRVEILLKIEILLEQLDENTRKKYPRLKSKK